MVLGLLTWVSFANRLRREQECGVLLQLRRRVAIRVAVHMVCGLRHLSTFRCRRRRSRRVALKLVFVIQIRSGCIAHTVESF